MDFLEKDVMISQIFQPRLGNLRYIPKSSVRAPSVRAALRFLTLEDIDKKAMEAFDHGDFEMLADQPKTPSSQQPPQRIHR